MLHYLQNKWTSFRERRRQAKELSPEAFEKLVCEILQLAGMTEKIHSRENAMQVKLSLLHQELSQLQALLQKKEFKQLSHNRKLELKKNLVFSKNQLLEAMYSVPPPTDVIQ